MTKPKRKPRPLPTKKERAATPEWENCGPGAPLASAPFPRPMGVPCVDLNTTASGTVTTTAYFAAPVEWPQLAHVPPTEPFPFAVAWKDVRYLTAKGLLALARTIRRLAWKVAP